MHKEIRHHDEKGAAEKSGKADTVKPLDDGINAKQYNISIFNIFQEIERGFTGRINNKQNSNKAKKNLQKCTI